MRSGPGRWPGAQRQRIAHRLSTIAMLDRRVVIDEGQSVESGFWPS